MVTDDDDNDDAADDDNDDDDDGDADDDAGNIKDNKGIVVPPRRPSGATPCASANANIHTFRGRGYNFVLVLGWTHDGLAWPHHGTMPTLMGPSQNQAKVVPRPLWASGGLGPCWQGSTETRPCLYICIYKCVCVDICMFRYVRI